MVEFWVMALGSLVSGLLGVYLARPEPHFPPGEAVPGLSRSEAAAYARIRTQRARGPVDEATMAVLTAFVDSDLSAMGMVEEDVPALQASA